MTFTHISSITLEFCLFQVDLQNSTLQAQHMWVGDYFEALWIKEDSKNGPK